MTVVLIVEDNARNLKLVRDLLEYAGYRTLEATTAEDGLALARAHRPDLVLMDVNLPGINGLDATRQILAASADSIVVLLLSTYEEEEYAPRAAECGAAAYIPKAVFGPDRLEQAWAAASQST